MCNFSACMIAKIYINLVIHLLYATKIVEYSTTFNDIYNYSNKYVYLCPIK